MVHMIIKADKICVTDCSNVFGISWPLLIAHKSPFHKCHMTVGSIVPVLLNRLTVE